MVLFFKKELLASTLVAVAAYARGALVSPPPAQAREFATLYSFTGTPDGAGPYAGLIYRAGKLYGTTGAGGAMNYGAIFKFNLSGGRETILHSLAGSPDGQLPEAELLAHGAALYGTTAYGGGSGNGAIFEVDPNTGAETVIYSFAGGADGGQPMAGLIWHGGALYGSTTGGGLSDYGTVFKFDPATGGETVLYNFAGGTDGKYPFSGVIYHAGKLFGTTSAGGASGHGTVFRLDPATGRETVLHSFAGGNDGATPLGTLVAHGGRVFGTTDGGGGNGCVFASGCGTVFQLDLATGVEAVLHSFAGGADGAYPMDGLLYQGGALYGVTFGDDIASDYGTLFKVMPATGAEAVLHRFHGTTDGALPMSVPIYYDGSFYGTAGSGGTGCGGSGCGTVFRFTP